MFTQLNPPIPLDVLEKGRGQAIGVIDYGPEQDLVWVTAMEGTGEIWRALNPTVRVSANCALGKPRPVNDHGTFNPIDPALRAISYGSQ